MSKPASDRIPRVLITVSGGVADVICKPAGVDVRIYDYDVEGCEEAKLDHDPDNQPCVIRRFTTSEPVLANRHWPIVSHSLDDLARINARRWKCPSSRCWPTGTGRSSVTLSTILPGSTPAGGSAPPAADPLSTPTRPLPRSARRSAAIAIRTWRWSGPDVALTHPVPTFSLSPSRLSPPERKSSNAEPRYLCARTARVRPSATTSCTVSSSPNPLHERNAP